MESTAQEIQLDEKPYCEYGLDLLGEVVENLPLIRAKAYSLAKSSTVADILRLTELLDSLTGILSEDF